VVTRDYEVSEITEIVRVLGAEDLKFLDTLRRRRRVLGIAFIIIGFAIIGLMPFYASFVGGGSFIWVLFGLFMGSLLLREGSVALQEAKSIAIPGGGRYKVFVKITCSDASCGYSEVRERYGNEYVGKVLDKSCPKCGGKLIVTAIFSEPEKKLKTIGMPILPGMGMQVGVLKLLAYYIVDMFSPFKVAFRFIKRKLSLGGVGEKED